MLYASPGPDNTSIDLLMIGNTLPGLTSLFSNCIGRMHVYEYGDNINNPYWIIHPVYQQGTVQSGAVSVMLWDVCSWRDMGPLIRLETTLTGDRYLSILPDHLHSFMPIVHSNRLGQFQQDNATPTRRELLPSGSRNTLLTLDTHLNPQT
ncbi:hypothetical protein AVEN_232459-1 [Araneus ventricosus]|uniref:Uncharacterized protein n=1 Tax=Araneus ventricosus TaxID=182803 RepID=A0A4Y2E875_ARAVE|nr:hypothetical protein AVEN_232459-1 [Araneus ventricosus]